MKLSKEQFESIIQECRLTFSRFDDIMEQIEFDVIRSVKIEGLEEKYEKFEPFKIFSEQNAHSASLLLNEDGSVKFSVENRINQQFVINVKPLTKQNYKDFTSKNSSDNFFDVLSIAVFNNDSNNVKYYMVFLIKDENNKLRLQLVECAEKTDFKNRINSEPLTKKEIKETFVLQKPLTTTDSIEAK